jgi:glycosyltransferase involved in cell wall biosynthesis
MRVAFIVQRCGKEVNGGAEYHCLRIAQLMSSHWQTEVLSTCALDYMTWEDHYPEGLEEADGTVIRRFPVDAPRDVASFNRYSGSIHRKIKKASLKEQEEWMRRQGPCSTALLDYIKENKDKYDVFFFFTYLYAQSYFGLPLAQEKAVLAPLAHDEWPIYMSMWDDFFSKPRFFIFNTVEERSFLQKRFPKIPFQGPVVGVGVDPPKEANAPRFREKYGIHEPFMLYVGRVDESKGCRELFNAFKRRQKKDGGYKLVLMGKEVMKIPKRDDIIHLGFVSDQDKWDGLAAAELLINPSPHESLSIVLLEAWWAGTPVMVTAKSEVMLGQCRRADGGLWYENEEMFARVLRWFETHPEEANILGEQGKAYVSENYSWDKVRRQYLDAVEEYFGASGADLRYRST